MAFAKRSVMVAAVFVLVSLGLMAKPMLVTLPVLLLLLDEVVIHFREAVRLAPRRRSPRAARGGAREERSRRGGRQGVGSWTSGLKTGGRLWNGAGSPPAHTVRGLLTRAASSENKDRKQPLMSLTGFSRASAIPPRRRAEGPAR